ncbi:MAG: DNA/RNA nuclease SfsA [Desulfobacteraceae bacterium]|nr:DNA/RNA nuclease SfsA [Desulfobacteraceae bacterium]MBC2751121.1 DNA/RNA nuclease SfsA [Desulfobacteraceae bacterium]
MNHEPASPAGLTWPPLVRGTLIKRYKRFLADVILENGTTVTAHCPNTGSMTDCCEPGRPVYLSVHDNPKRKYPYTWELIQMPDSLVGVNTLVPNRLVKHAIRTDQVAPLRGYTEVRSEVQMGARSRVDLMLQDDDRGTCHVEIKNCTMVRDGLARFPDAVTTRGLKHLHELTAQLSERNRSVMFYLIQRMDAEEFRPADDIDPAYGKALRQAVARGVEILAYDVHIDLNEIRLNQHRPCRL